MSLAKFTAPRQAGLLQRIRLHERLSNLRTRHAAIWLHAPAGAGKTALASAWLQEVGLPAIWFHVDALDRDADALFRYLAESVRTQLTLPELESSIRKDKVSFAKHFFARYFAALPANGVLVLNDLHEIGLEEHAALLTAMIEAIPAGFTVLATSRLAPPASLQSQLDDARLALLDWDALRFDIVEGAQLTGLDSADTASQTLLAQADGWAAALVLLRGQLQSGSQLAPLKSAPGNFFNYLARDFFEQLSANEQWALMAISLLPDASEADAFALLGDQRGGGILQRMYRERLLIDRRDGDPPRFVLHALFRDFLAAQAEQQWSASEYAAFRIHAAMLLEARGDTQGAIELYRHAGAHTDLIRLLKGRARMLDLPSSARDWLDLYDSLPPELALADAWLQALRGRCLFGCQDESAAKVLANAEDLLRTQGQVQRTFDALYWQIDYLSHAYARGTATLETLSAPVLRLCEALPLLDELPVETSLLVRMYSIAVYGCGLCNVQTVDIVALSRRVTEIISKVEDAYVRLTSAQFVTVCAPVLPPELTRGLLDAALGPAGLASLRILAQRHPARVIRFAKQFHWASFFVLAEFAFGERLYDLIQELAREWKLQMTSDLDPSFLLARRRLKEAVPLIEDYRLRFAMEKGNGQTTIHLFDAFLAMHNGDATGALAQAKAALDLTIAAGLPPGRRYEADLFTIFFAALAGEYALSRQLIAEQMTLNVGAMRRNMEVISLLLDGDAAAQAGDYDAARPLLGRALALHREGPPVFLARFAPLAERILDSALVLGVESDHVRGIIRRQELRAPLLFMGHWPWPIAVRTLGGFKLAFHGQPHEFKGKLPLKPLQMLKLLTQAKHGRMNVDQINAALWPEAEYPLPAFQISLHRLRGMLGTDNAVMFSENNVELNSTLVWTDVAALQSCAAYVHSMREDTPLRTLQRVAEMLQDLYRGHFLFGEEDAPWIIEARVRYSQRLHDTASALAARMVTIGGGKHALALYRLALQADPLAEQCWRAYMRCAALNGERAIAQEAWEHCRRNLSVLIGRQPGVDTIEVAREFNLH